MECGKFAKFCKHTFKFVVSRAEFDEHSSEFIGILRNSSKFRRYHPNPLQFAEMQPIFWTLTPAKKNEDLYFASVAQNLNLSRPTCTTRWIPSSAAARSASRSGTPRSRSSRPTPSRRWRIFEETIPNQGSRVLIFLLPDFAKFNFSSC